MDLIPTNASGPTKSHKFRGLATTNINVVSAGPAKLTGGFLRNRKATEIFFKLYNKATAPVLASDVPVMTIAIPATSGAINISEIVGAAGWLFTAGLSYAVTGAYADNDTTALVAGDCDVNLIYV